MFNYIPLDTTIVFDAVTHDPGTMNIANADSVPTFDVFEDATDTPMAAYAAAVMTLRTAKTGNYRASVTFSAANGFEVGKSYNIVATGIVTNTQTLLAVTSKKTFPTFLVGPAVASAGVFKVDLSYILGTPSAGGAGTIRADQVSGNITGSLLGALTNTERVAIADALLDRDMALGTDTGTTAGVSGRTVRQALRVLRNKWTLVAGLFRSYKEDDAATSFTAVTAETAGDPVSSVDPS